MDIVWINEIVPCQHVGGCYLFHLHRCFFFSIPKEKIHKNIGKEKDFYRRDLKWIGMFL